MSRGLAPVFAMEMQWSTGIELYRREHGAAMRIYYDRLTYFGEVLPIQTGDQYRYVGWHSGTASGVFGLHLTLPCRSEVASRPTLHPRATYAKDNSKPFFYE